MLEPRVDIVIPVHDTPLDDLEACLESVERQSYQAWRAIVVDDGSCNEVARRLDGWAARDSRFSVVHSAQRGVSHARNIGLSLIDAKYLAFCDADDRLKPSFMEQAVAFAEREGLDQAIGAVEVTRDGAAVAKGCPKQTVITRADERAYEGVVGYLLTNRGGGSGDFIGDAMMGRVYPKLFLRSSMEGVRFEESLSISEDSVFALDSILKAGKVGFCPAAWYEHRENACSTLSTVWGGKRAAAFFEAAEAFFERADASSSNVNDYRFRIAMIARSALGAFRNGPVSDLSECISHIVESPVFLWAFDRLDLSPYKLSNPEKLFFAINRPGRPLNARGLWLYARLKRAHR